VGISFSTGKPFDPTFQKRIDAIDDIIKADTRRLKLTKPKFDMQLRSGDYGILRVKHMIEKRSVEDVYIVETDILGRVTVKREVRNYG
jgi:hypothetical protein